ncbi:glycosyltransferase family 2 protein [Bacteroides sp. 519]|uniref:glycosyltransferase family 2 protein n=1 Tax=Bacteroides sp. 519 TaxID=2302937 RepID=UPI0013CFF070|nr:glycosyltransferase family 2 protein [Bacteroides sp. 519]NDV58032.1 glycosyltransferase family 2 protein [Bacteroides sp. 519]
MEITCSNENVQRQILVSICIPTYNRSAILKDTMQRITSDPAFDEEVELIISDNNSTDDTGDVVREFTDKYSNVRYYRNEENVRDRNFQVVLSYAHGDYLKLQNDYIYFPEGQLAFMKECIRKYQSTRQPLFFIRKVRKELAKQSEIVCNSLDEYIYTVSYYSTWLSSFGCWHEDFEALTEKDRYFYTSLQQVDWIYRIVSSKNCAIIIHHNIFETTKLPLGPRGGYNYFGVHVGKYYEIMEDCMDAQLVSKPIFNKDRRYTLYMYRERFIRYLLFPKKGNYFEMDKSLLVIWHYYKRFPLFYLIMLVFILALILKIIYWPFKALVGLFKK